VIRYSKTIVALAGWLALLGQALANGTVDATEAGALVTSGAVVIGVFAARNRDPAPAQDFTDPDRPLVP
jgi:hypothetical protein